MTPDRRRFLLRTSATAAAPLLALSRPSGCLAIGAGQEKESPPAVSLAEIVVREHGLLNRILLIYEEGIRQLKAKEDTPPEVFQSAAQLARNYVEDHHAKLEEELLFHEFIRRKLLHELVVTLKKQQEVGRELTDQILRLSTAAEYGKTESRAELVQAMEAFVRMYRPHLARKETVLFPELSKVFSGQELKELGEKFAEREEKRFGEGGFAKVVEQVNEIEKRLKIDDLDQFTYREAK